MGELSSNRLSIRERRRPREHRRGTGINFWTKDVSGGLCRVGLGPGLPFVWSSRGLLHVA